jgi:ubiquinone biosynthesis protein
MFVGLRYIRRYREIVFTLMRHGFGWLIVRLGLSSLVPFHWGLLGHPRRKERYSGPEHLRMAFESLGPTFIKLAQILSTRPDLISPFYAEEFSRLLDRVPPRPSEEMRLVLESELNVPYREVFPQFDWGAVASASIGQVYRAELADGKRVVVKIQKPEVSELIAWDLRILKNVVQRIRRHTDFGERYDLTGLLDEFGFFLVNELDYVREARNADRFRLMFKDDPHIVVPKIYWDYTTSRVLVMDEVRGVKVNELSANRGVSQTDRHILARVAVEATFKEVFEHGFFHADPHPGNFVIMEGQKLGLIDFGLVGYLDKHYRESFLRFTYEIVMGDAEETIDALWELGITGKFANRPALKRDLNHLIFRFRESSLGEMAAGDLVREVMTIAYRHQLFFPPDLALLFKVVAMCESLGAMLDPEFRLVDFAEPYLRREYKNLLRPENVVQQLENDAIHLLHFGRGLPQRVARLLRRVELGDIQVSIRHKELDESTAKISRALNRLTVTILFTLFLIAVGIYIIAGHLMGFHYYLVNTLLAMVIATALVAARVLYNMWRRGK